MPGWSYRACSCLLLIEAAPNLIISHSTSTWQLIDNQTYLARKSVARGATMESHLVLLPWKTKHNVQWRNHTKYIFCEELLSINSVKRTSLIETSVAVIWVAAPTARFTSIQTKSFQQRTYQQYASCHFAKHSIKGRKHDLVLGIHRPLEIAS